MFLGLLVATSAMAQSRLPESIRPERYSIEWSPDLRAHTFTGRETIRVQVAAASKTIALHAVDLKILAASVGGVAAKVRPGSDQTIVLELPSPVAPGTVEIFISWSGELNDQLRGFYRSQSGGHDYAATQFEATDARRAFPCFDEPAFKARFAMTVRIPVGDVAISNGAVIEENTEQGGATKVVRFAETPPISTYLVALAVGPFEHIEARVGDVPVRLFAAPGQTKFGSYALNLAKEMLPRFEKYFGVRYPYGKLDLVAVPDFEAGAMENAGAIFFREVRLLIDPKSASAESQRNVAFVVAHEMAHQWFGDLVTMRWWDDLWLNEAFASWMENKVVDEIQPEWKVWEQFVADTQRALSDDAFATTHPVRVPVRTPEEAEENFDNITYLKGSAVIRMLEKYVGEEAFRRGVAQYIAAHAEKNATTEDLLRSLRTVTDKPVMEVAQGWFEQPGFPEVELSLSCRGGKTRVLLEQHRFFVRGGEAKRAKPQTWMIPICVRAGKQVTCTLLTEKSDDLFFDHCVSWVDGNSDATGYFRVRYDSKSFAALKSEAPGLSTAERLALLGDTVALAEAGHVKLGDVFAMISVLKQDASYLVIDSASAALQFVYDDFLDSRERDEALLTRWVQREFGPIAPSLGKANKSQADRMRAAALAELLVRIGRWPQLMVEVRTLFSDLLKNSALLDGTVADVVAPLGASMADGRRYDEMVAALAGPLAPEDADRLLLALGAVEDPKLVARTLTRLEGKEVRSQDLFRLLRVLLGNARARQATWVFLKTHFAELNRRMPGAMVRVVRALGGFCDPKTRADINHFFADPAHHVESGERSLRQALSSIDMCVDYKRREAATLPKLLKE